MLTAKEANKIIPATNDKTLIDKISDLIQKNAETGEKQINLCCNFKERTFFNFLYDPDYDDSTSLNSVGNNVVDTLIKNGYEVDIDYNNLDGPDLIVKW